jgi:hypothetical protein
LAPSGEHGFGNNNLLDSRGDEDRALLRLGNISRVFNGNVSTSDKGWHMLKPKKTAPFLLSSHGLGMWGEFFFYIFCYCYCYCCYFYDCYYALIPTSTP